MGDNVNTCVPKLPVKRIILKKDYIKSNVRVLRPAYREEVVFETDKCNFLPGNYSKFTLSNRTYYANKNIKTVAKFVSHNDVTIKTSEEIVKLIGQTNYDTVFSTICSVFNQELKIRGIVSLLTDPKTFTENSTQTDIIYIPTEKEDKSCQYNEKDLVVKPRSRRKRQALTPYSVPDKPERIKKFVITPNDFKKILPSLKTEQELPELGSMLLDDNSNDSIGKFSSLSVETTPELLSNPSILLDNVDRHTQSVSSGVIQKSMASTVSPCKEPLPVSTSSDDKCSLASINTPLTTEQTKKTVLQQMAVDWKNCLQRDEDGYLPIHVAVLSNDLDMLRRQCIILKIRNETVDIPAAGGITGLKMSLYEDNGEMTAMLLHFGADPMASDDDNRTLFHIAAEMSGEHTQALISHCQKYARNILHDEGLWKPEFEVKSDEELSNYLLNHICKLCDSQGYTPLMLASKMGKYTNVRQFVDVSSDIINMQAPNSGNTALYLAVGAACMDAAEKGNKTKVSDHYRQTIELLLENGADPNITNFSNSNINDLVTEYTCVELSLMIANKLLSAAKVPSEDMSDKNIGSFMLVKEKDGAVKLINMSNKSKTKPFIVANELYKPAAGAAQKTNVRQQSGNSVKLDNSSQSATNPNIAQGVEILKVFDKSETGVVENYKLNKPLIIKSDMSKNKRKLKIFVSPETHGKKSKT